MKGRTVVTVRLSESIQRRLKSTTALQGKTIQEVLEEAAKQYVAAHESGQARELAEALEGGRV